MFPESTGSRAGLLRPKGLEGLLPLLRTMQLYQLPELLQFFRRCPALVVMKVVLYVLALASLLRNVVGATYASIVVKAITTCLGIVWWSCLGTFEQIGVYVLKELLLRERLRLNV